jgi:hypothetical protein
VAELGSERIPWTYTDDAGFQWRVAATEGVVSQGKQGGATALATVPPKPANIKMRRATVKSGTVSRTVVLYDATQTLVVGATLGTINLNILQVETTMTATGSIIPERRPRISVISTPS